MILRTFRFSYLGLIIIFNISVFTSSAQTLPEEEQKFNLENCVVRYDEKSAEDTQVGSQFWFVDRNFLDGRTIKMSKVRAGHATHEPHVHAEDEFFFILEGKAKFHLNGEEVIVGPLTSLYCPPHSVHGISNAGDQELSYLVIKKYKKDSNQTK